MRIAIHQPHFFPWTGYLDKMVKVDAFVILDEVQLENSSRMFRNQFLAKNGEAKWQGIPYDKHGFMDKRFCDISVNRAIDWKRKQRNFFQENYRKAKGFDEAMSMLERLWEKDYGTVCEYAMESIRIMREQFEIDTPLLFQSDIDYDRDAKKNDLVLSLCEATNTTVYLSGAGARKYMDTDSFERKGIEVRFQRYEQPTYNQRGSTEFVSGLSALDMLFNCGIDESKALFVQGSTER